MTVQFVETNLADATAEWASDVDSEDYEHDTNDDVVVNIPVPGPGMHNIVDIIAWSYSAAPAAGYVSIEDLSTTPPTEVFRLDIVHAGYGWCPVKKRGTTNAALDITLGDGGQGIVGRLNIIGRRTE